VLTKTLKLILASLPGLICSFSSPVYAQQPIITTGGGGGNSITGLHLSELADILVGIINDLLAVAGVVTIIIIVVGGIRMILSAGDIKAMQSARASVTFGIVGLVIILLAVAIVIIVGKFFGVSNLTFVHIG
jgi:hypothetical protein